MRQDTIEGVLRDDLDAPMSPGQRPPSNIRTVPSEIYAKPQPKRPRDDELATRSVGPIAPRDCHSRARVWGTDWVWKRRQQTATAATPRTTETYTRPRDCRAGPSRKARSFCNGFANLDQCGGGRGGGKARGMQPQRRSDSLNPKSCNPKGRVK